MIENTDARYATTNADDWRLGRASAGTTETVVEDHELKGAALDAALDAAGLPKTGTADEKRARLAEHNDTPAPNTSSNTSG